MGFLFGAGLALVLLGLVLYMVFRHKPTPVVDNAQLSNGTYDKFTVKALQEYAQLAQPTRQQEFARGQLIDLNVFEGENLDTAALDTVALSYTRVLEDPGLDWFEHAQIQHFADRNQDVLDPEFIVGVETRRPKPRKTRNAPKVDAVDDYIEQAVTHTSDAQNVHDTALQSQLGMYYNRLNRLVSGVPEVPYTPKDKHKYVYDTMSRAGVNSKINSTERSLIDKVNTRINARDNVENKELLEEALDNALDEMQSDGGVVCSTGRVSRLLGVFTLLDSDSTLKAGFTSLEQIRNDALHDSSRILQECISEYKDHANELGQVAKSYTDTSVKVSPESEKMFTDIVKVKIQNNMNEKYREMMPSRSYIQILEECEAALS